MPFIRPDAQTILAAMDAYIDACSDDIDRSIGTITRRLSAGITCSNEHYTALARRHHLACVMYDLFLLATLRVD